MTKATQKNIDDLLDYHPGLNSAGYTIKYDGKNQAQYRTAREGK